MDKDQRKNSPPLQGRGRGWGLSVETLDRLHGHAREMRNAPTEPERRLWARLRNSQLNGAKFRRQATIGRHIVDFYCPAAALIIEVDGDTHTDARKDAVRDGQLAEMGLMVVRVTNHDVMRNIDGALATIAELLGMIGHGDDRPHPNPSPEGEGLSVEAQKLLGISLEGSVG